MHRMMPGNPLLPSAITDACEVATEPYKDHARPFVPTTDERRDLPLPGERPAGGGI